MGAKISHNFILKKLGNNIQKRGNEKGISQEKLAEIIHMHRTYIGLVERGERNPTIRTIYKTCKALNANSSELFGF